VRPLYLFGHKLDAASYCLLRKLRTLVGYPRTAKQRRDPGSVGGPLIRPARLGTPI
jgi:hypothetical protein